VFLAGNEARLINPLPQFAYAFRVSQRKNLGGAGQSALRRPTLWR